MNVIKQLDIRA